MKKRRILTGFMIMFLFLGTMQTVTAEVEQTGDGMFEDMTDSEERLGISAS